MATIQVNLVDNNTGQPKAPFFYNLVAGDSYELQPYNGGDSDSDNLVIKVKDGSGNDKETITISRYDGSRDGDSMPKNLSRGVNAATNPQYRLEPPVNTDVIWNKLSGEAWDEAVNDATSNGGEPGVFQEAIWYQNGDDEEIFQKLQDSYKDQQAELAAEMTQAKDEAATNGFDSFRTPGAGILPVNGTPNLGEVATSIIGTIADKLPFLGKVGVVYKEVTVTTAGPGE
jgi:hypothetical protein